MKESQRVFLYDIQEKTNMSVRQENIIVRLKCALSYAAGKLSALPENSNKHPEVVLNELLDCRLSLEDCGEDDYEAPSKKKCDSCGMDYLGCICEDNEEEED